MTSPAHASGSDRLAEAAQKIACDVVVNVQGDEPLIAPATIERAVRALLEDGGAACATTSEPVESAADVLSGDVVKVVADALARAIPARRGAAPRLSRRGARGRARPARDLPQAHGALCLRPRLFVRIRALAADRARTRRIARTTAHPRTRSRHPRGRGGLEV